MSLYKAVDNSTDRIAESLHNYSTNSS